MSPNATKCRGLQAERSCWPATALLIAFALLAANIAPTACGADPPAALPADLALVPPDAVAFVHVRVADWLRASGKEGAKYVAGTIPMSDAVVALTNDANTDRLTHIFVPREGVLSRNQRSRGELGAAHIVVVATIKPIDRGKILANSLGRFRQEEYRGRTVYVSTGADDGRAVHVVGDRLYVVAMHGVPSLRYLLRHADRPRGNGPLRPALNAAAPGKSLLAASINPEVMRAQVEDGSSDSWLRRMFDFTILHRLFEAGSVTLAIHRTEKKLHLTVDVDYEEELYSRWGLTAWRTAAGTGRETFAELADKFAGDRQSLRLATVLRQLEDALADARIERHGGVVRLEATVNSSLGELTAALADGAVRAQQAGDRAAAAFNLYMIALAIHQFQDINGRLPANITDKEGKPLLSWRVEILSCLGESEDIDLYREFKRDEPWDSPRNKKLLMRMPKRFAPIGVRTKEPYTTFHQGFSGGGTFFGIPRPKGYDDVPDGAKNTIMLVEAGEAVPWTKPDDMPYDPKQPLPKLGGQFPDGFHAAFADATVQFIPRDFDEEKLRAGILINDGKRFDRKLLIGPVVPRSASKE